VKDNYSKDLGFGTENLATGAGRKQRPPKPRNTRNKKTGDSIDSIDSFQRYNA